MNIYTPPPKLCVKCGVRVGPGDYESIPAHVDCILIASVQRQIDKERKAEAKAAAELERRKKAQ